MRRAESNAMSLVLAAGLLSGVLLGALPGSGRTTRAQDSLELVRPLVTVSEPGETNPAFVETLSIAWVNRMSRLSQPGLVLFLPDPVLPATTLAPPGNLEVIVRQGVVERINTHGNSPIPADGFVIGVPPSMMMSVLRAGVKVGKAVKLDLYNLERMEASVSRRIDGFNRNRGTDELIIYRPAPGRTRTLTNEWGIEAVVVNGRVVSVGGNNQLIPPDGFVVSGYGAPESWISENVQVGQRAEILGSDGQSHGYDLVLTVDAETYVIRAERRLAELEQALAAAEASWADIAYTPARQALEKGRELVGRARAQLAEMGAGVASVSRARSEDQASAVKAVVSTALQAQAEADRGRLLAYPSASVSLRGAWYCLVTPTSPEEIAAILDCFQAAGFNAVFLDTFWHGQTLWPSEIGKQRAEYDGWDPMAVWIEEAHKRGIELHARVSVFKVGSGGASTLLDAHPEWALRRPDGMITTALEPGYVFVDPGNPEVQRFLSDLFAELVTKYELDGFQYDYIRYPTGTGDNPVAIAMGEAERQIFQAETGIDPASLSPARNPAEWRRWAEWRMGQVTRFVAETSSRLKKIRPNLQLSAAVISNPALARSSRLQDWPTWLKAGYLDFICPMAYNEFDPGYVEHQARSAAALASPKAFAATGITIMKEALPYALPHTMAVLSANNPGVVQFAFNYADGGLLRELKAGPFRLPAAPPYDVAGAALTLAKRLDLRLGPERPQVEGVAGIGTDQPKPEPGNCPEQVPPGVDQLDPLYRAAQAHPEAAARVRQALANLVEAAGQAKQAGTSSCRAPQETLKEAVEALQAALATLAREQGAAADWLLQQVAYIADAARRNISMR